MTRFAGVVALLATICLLPAAGAGNSTATALQNAALAWERGDYTSALTTYQELLAGPDADGVLDSIALQTGELYQTTELTTDGSNPGISTDGKYASYETGSGPTRVTRLVSLTSPTAASRRGRRDGLADRRAPGLWGGLLARRLEAGLSEALSIAGAQGCVRRARSRATGRAKRSAGGCERAIRARGHHYRSRYGDRPRGGTEDRRDWSRARWSSDRPTWFSSPAQARLAGLHSRSTPLPKAGRQHR